MITNLLNWIFPESTPYKKVINRVLKTYCGTDEMGRPNAYVGSFFERGDAYLYDIQRNGAFPINRVLAVETELEEVFANINNDLNVHIDSKPLRVTVDKIVPEKQLLIDYWNDIWRQAPKNKMISIPGVGYVGKEIELFGIGLSNESFCHILISGSTGAGKTMLSLSLLLTLAALNSPEMCTIVIADKKGGLDFEPIAGLPHIPNQKLFVTDDEIKKAIDEVHSELINRIEKQDRQSMSKHIVLVIDEFHQFSNNKKAVEKMKDLSAMGRAWGVHLIAITQRPDHKSIDTTLRSNLVAEFAGRMTRKGSKGLEAGEDGELQSKLPGKGLFLARAATSDNKRVQGFWIDDVQKWVTAIQSEYKGQQPHFQTETAYTIQAAEKANVGRSVEVEGAALETEKTDQQALSEADQQKLSEASLPNTLNQWQSLFDKAKEAIKEGEEISQSWFRKMAPDVVGKQINANTANKLLKLLEL